MTGNMEIHNRKVYFYIHRDMDSSYVHTIVAECLFFLWLIKESSIRHVVLSVISPEITFHPILFVLQISRFIVYASML